MFIGLARTRFPEAVGGPNSLREKKEKKTMQRIPTSEVGSHAGERVHVMGWLHSLRQLGGINFLVIRDGWGIVQAVAETEAELIPLRQGEIGVESVLAVEGLVVSEAQAPGGIELHGLQIEVITPVTEVPPVALN